jgi:23S rRNA (adenine2503-C2)-methyltransferase
MKQQEHIDTKRVLTGLMPEGIATSAGLAPLQAKQVFQWIHQKKVWDFEQMTNLSKPLRAQLAETAVAADVTLIEMQVCRRTGTKKALIRLNDGESVESVLIRDGERITLCVSSQVGCALKCDFCATGLAGFTRNLNPGEIAAQALLLLRGEDLSGRNPNVVYMGMGEPFRNYDSVMESIRLLMHPEGLGIGARKITVSTAGEVKEIERFGQEPWQVRLSVSLHAANNELRSRLVPLNRKYPLERLKESLLRYQGLNGRQLTFEWTLLDGVNDSIQHANELLYFARGLQVSVNLIPWNPVRELPYATSTRERCNAFVEHVTAKGLKATLRKEKGRDIDAACGQLRRTHAG